MFKGYGLKTFIKIETAAKFALLHGIDPATLMILKEGRLKEPCRWEISELCSYMRDLAPPSYSQNLCA